MAQLLQNTQVNPLPSGGCTVCIAPNCSSIMGRGVLWSPSNNASLPACKNTVFGFRIANYYNNHCVRKSTMVGWDVNQGFGNSTACIGSKGNTLIGGKAGYDIRSGANGDACGYWNTVLGSNTGIQIQFGSGNIAIHPFAMFSQGNSASHNIAIGDVAFRGYGVTGDRNIAIGCAAFQGINSSCSGNVMIGVRSGRYAQYRKCLTAIGFGSSCGGSFFNDCGVSVGAYSNVSGCCSTVIGNGATGGYGLTNNKIAITVSCNPWYAAGHTILGNANHNAAYIGKKWTNVSDCRDKTNIKPLHSNLGLPFIKKLNPVKFNWDKRDKYVKKCGFEWGQKDGTLVEEKEQYGFIAQEIEQALNELNVSFDALAKQKSQHNENVQSYNLKYLDLVSPMVQSLKDLIEDLEATEARLEALKS